MRVLTLSAILVCVGWAAATCPPSHPYAACDRCFTGKAQAKSSGCKIPAPYRQKAPRNKGKGRKSGGGKGRKSGGGKSAKCGGTHPVAGCQRCWESVQQAAQGGCHLGAAPTPPPAGKVCKGKHPVAACGRCWKSVAKAKLAGCISAGVPPYVDPKPPTSPDCPYSHPYRACGRCFQTPSQAASGCSAYGNGNAKAVCTVWGDPHVTSFDGTVFDHHGVGEFVYYSQGDVEVVLSQWNCMGTPSPLTCVGRVRVAAGGASMEVQRVDLQGLPHGAHGRVDIALSNGQQYSVNSFNSLPTAGGVKMTRATRIDHVKALYKFELKGSSGAVVEVEARLDYSFDVDIKHDGPTAGLSGFCTDDCPATSYSVFGNKDCTPYLTPAPPVYTPTPHYPTPKPPTPEPPTYPTPKPPTPEPPTYPTPEPPTYPTPKPPTPEPPTYPTPKPRTPEPPTYPTPEPPTYPTPKPPTPEPPTYPTPKPPTPEPPTYPTPKPRTPEPPTYPTPEPPTYPTPVPSTLAPVPITNVCEDDPDAGLWVTQGCCEPFLGCAGADQVSTCTMENCIAGSWNGSPEESTCSTKFYINLVRNGMCSDLLCPPGITGDDCVACIMNGFACWNQ